MEELSSALFFAISREDYEQAGKLLKAGANPNGVYEVSKGHYMSSFNLFITKASAFGHTKGPTNTQYRSCIALMKPFLQRSSLECKCLKQHKCPLYIALETFKISNEDQILQHKCDLLRHLIVAGATIKFQPHQDSKSKPNKWTLKWFDLQGIRSYLVTKNFKYVQTKV